ncbi:MAG: hypothetical protein NZ934_01380, partial [Hadesarchaea archaeon]|nr:hypothetical protein [Hadesarchaea archaeon]
MLKLRQRDGIAASDVIRSMKRLGFADDEIYDTLTGIGLPGEQIQLLIDRVSAEFHETGLKPQTFRLASEAEKVFQKAFMEANSILLAKMDLLSRELRSVKNELEKLNIYLTELQLFEHDKKLEEVNPKTVYITS